MQACWGGIHSPSLCWLLPGGGGPCEGGHLLQETVLWEPGFGGHPSKRCTSAGGRGHCCLFMSAFHLLSLAERGETSARGMMTGSPSPRTRRRGAASMSHVGSPHLLACCPFFSPPPPSQGPAGPCTLCSSVYPGAPNRGSGQTPWWGLPSPLPPHA